MKKVKNDSAKTDPVLANDKSPDSQIHDYEVHSAAEDLLRAEKHKSNPKLMAKVHAHLSKTKKAIKSIQDIKDARDAMMKEDKEGFEDDCAEPKMKKGQVKQNKLGFESGAGDKGE